MRTPPQDPPGPPPGETKRAILDALVRDALRAEDLAERLGVTAAAVRQHLGALRAAGLVLRDAEPEGAGRPAFRYRLSVTGMRAFPKRYDLLVTEVVEAIVERLGQEDALEVVAAAARRTARRFPDPGPVGEAERWDRVLAWIEEVFAWEADVEDRDDGARRIVLHHCPFLDVSADRPAVCGAFFAALLAELVEGRRIEHVPIRDGVRCCALEVEAG